jgi:hypothetical protein
MLYNVGEEEVSSALLVPPLTFAIPFLFLLLLYHEHSACRIGASWLCV